MDNITLKIEAIKQHGFLGASVLVAINQGKRTAPTITEYLHFTTERQIETALEALRKSKEIERLEKPGGIKTAFIL